VKALAVGGDLTILGFTVLDGDLFITGVLDDTATRTTGSATRINNQRVTAPITSLLNGLAEPGVCDILFLDLLGLTAAAHRRGRAGLCRMAESLPHAEQAREFRACTPLRVNLAWGLSGVS
jgi:hypothetical protein